MSPTAPATAGPAASARAAERRGLLLAFAAFGAFWGAWVVALPDLRAQTGVDDGQLGLALAAIALAALPAMPLAGRLVDRSGASRLLALALLLFGLAAVVPAFASGLLTLVPALVVVGATTGLLDVLLNTAAAAWERLEGERVMAAAHGCFSVGLLVASVATGAARDAGAGPRAVLGSTAQQRNLLATLLLSQGVPMLVAGDELNRSQGGNNNAYCQDNELNWINWDLDDEAQELLEATTRLIALRRDHPVFRRRRFFQGRPIHGSDLADVGWFGPDGTEMDQEQWLSGQLVALGMFLNGEEISEPGPRGERIVDDSFLLLLNGPNPVDFRLPNGKWASAFELVLDTAIGYARHEDDREGITLLADEELSLAARSLVILRKTG